MPLTKKQSARTRREKNRVQQQKSRAAARNTDFISPALLTQRTLAQSSIEQLVNYNEQMIDTGRKFDNCMSNLSLRTCTNCLKSSPELKLRESGKCLTCEDNPFKFSSENNMNPGPVPEQLQGLTYIEQMLIAQIHPVVSLYRIRGAQYSYSGNVINFRQNIDSYTTLLPHDPQSLMATVVFQKETISGIAEFQARANKLYDALIWLKHNNIYYSNIQISRRNLNAIPADGDLSRLLPSLDIPANIPADATGIDESFVPLIETIDQEHHIAKKLNLPYPEFDRSPINEFTEEGYIAKAFPCLFPTGNGDYLQARTTTLSRDEYFKFLMEYHDRRFAQDPRFRFFAMNSMMRHQALQASGVYIRRSNLMQSNIEDLKERINNDPRFLQQIMVHSSNLRSTKPYWSARCSELLTMVEQLGCPSIFFTLSAADYHWSDLFTLLAPGRQFSSLSADERRSLMHDNPLLVSWFFQHRCFILMKEVLKPLFGVTDFWFRFEWQHRGSPHIHGVLWLDGAPHPGVESLTDTQKNDIIHFYENLCVAMNPGDVTDLPDEHPSRKRFSEIPDDRRLEDLGHLINTFQRHTKCSRHCLRERDRTRKLKCRFDFPKSLQDAATIESPNGYPKFFPKRNDPLCARYNPFITQLWRANTDFTPILSEQAVLNYIAKYAAKGEQPSISYKETLNTLVTSHMGDTPAKTIVQKMMISTLGERNYSAQEVMHINMGWPLYRASREFVTLTIKDDDWSNILIDQSDGNTRVRQSLLEKYMTRPIDLLPDESLFYFAKKINKRKDTYHTRRRDAIVRVFPRIKPDLDPEKQEQYYKLQCILNIPFRGDFQNILDNLDCQTWTQAYEKSGVQELEHLDVPPPEDEGFLPERVNEDLLQEQYMVAASFRGMAADIGIGHRLVDRSYNWNSMPSFIPTYDEVSELLKAFKDTPTRRSTNTAQPTINFSSDQLSVLSIVDMQLKSLVQRSIRCPKRLVIQGKAGSGKSTVIKEIVRRVTSALGPDAIKVCAPTGAAAINIDGSTIHSLLRLPIVSSKFKYLNGESAQKFQNELKNMRFIIIDEMSMIGAKMLYMIDKRLREINPERDEFFGGLFIYLFGDFRQLPPVKDTPLYSTVFYDVMAQQGRHAFNSFQRFIELSNSHRQNSTDSSFREILEHLASGSFTQDDHNILITRNKAYLSPSELACFAEAVELYPTNDQVKESNERYLEQTGYPVAFISSENSPDIALPSSKDEASLGLAKHLKLSVNARVMLRTNLWVAGGLVNGSLGTVKYIVYAPDRRPPSLPLFILVEFDNYQGPYLIQNLLPIVPISRSWNDGNVTRCRRQFPLSLAYSMTIHKSQGLTLPRIKIDIGKQEKAIGLTYVAMSRVRNLSDIVFLKSYNKDRYDSICKSKAHHDRQIFLQQWHSNN